MYKRILSLVAIAIFAAGSALVFQFNSSRVANAATGCTAYVYGYGGNGTCVRYIQILLNNIPVVNPTLVVDGSFGPKTKAAVKQLQSDPWYKAGPPVDGIVGPKTWRALCYMNIHYGSSSSNTYKTAVNAGCKSIV